VFGRYSTMTTSTPKARRGFSVTTLLVVMAIFLAVALGLVMLLLDTTVAEVRPPDAGIIRDGQIALAALGSMTTVAAIAVATLFLVQFSRR